MNKNIAVILGDGIGPEVTQQSVKVLDAISRQFKHSFRYRYCLMGADAIDKTGKALPYETLAACLKSDAILFGAAGHPKYDGSPAAGVRPEHGLLQLRNELGLSTGIRPVTSYPSLYYLSPLKNSRLDHVDFIIFRALTDEGLSTKNQVNEEQATPDNFTFDNKEVERVALQAFKYAQKRRKVLTLIDKVVVTEAAGTWRKTVEDMATSFKDVTVDYMSLEHAARQLIMNPKQFDVVVTDNTSGAILGNEASVIAGSQGLLPSASVGQQHALFEPVHGSFPKATGRNIANPIGSILSAAMMLDHFELHEEAGLVREAVQWTLANGFVTRDIDAINNYSTSTIGDLITDYAEDRIPSRINRENMVISKSTII